MGSIRYSSLIRVRRVVTVAHFVKASGRTYTPTRCLILTADTETLASSPTDGTSAVALRSWCLLASRRRLTEWSEPRQYTGTTQAALWERIRSLGCEAPRQYIIAEEGADTATLCGLWSEVSAGRLSIQPAAAPAAPRGGAAPAAPRRNLPLVMTQACDIIGARWNDGNLRIVHPKNHGCNHWSDHAREVLTAEERKLWSTALRGDVRYWPQHLRGTVLLRYYQRLWQWWSVGDCGPWADSLGGLGWSWWRRTVPPRAVLEHDSEAAHNAECSAVFGGLTQTYFFGTVTSKPLPKRPTKALPAACSKATHVGPLYHVDHRAMYVSLMRDREYPVKLLGPVDTLDAATLAAGCKYVDMLLTVRVDAKRRSLPYRCGDGIVYPDGMRVTTLTTPEYLDCFRAGEVVEVMSGHRYTRGRPCAEYGKAALKLREQARALRDPIGETLAKSVGNALTGRLGRRVQRWHDAPKIVPPIEWGTYIHSPGHGEPDAMCRVLAGRVQRHEYTEKRFPGLTAIYATLLAYGRLLSHEVLRTAGKYGCVSWDTDGGWLTQAGYDNVKAAGLMGNGEAGRLRLVEVVQTGVFRAPKHYCVDGRYTLAGIKSGYTVSGNGELRWTDTLNPARSGESPGEGIVIVRDHSSAFSSCPASSPVSSSGWASPVSVSSGVVSISSAKASSIIDSSG